MVTDLCAIIGSLDEKPVLVGASMGGLVSLVAQAENPSLGRALVLVDVTPRLEADGVREITDFMASGTAGFATLEEAAEAIMAHTPQRRRAPRLDGLKKNLRKIGDRWHWHWDPHFLSHVEGKHGVPGSDSFADWAHGLARTIQVPTLLARGLESRVVGVDSVRELLDALPSAQFVDVAGTGHMVAGDDNDAFTAALLDFLENGANLVRTAEKAAKTHEVTDEGHPSPSR
jgi:pimeloyl-ACP methyl ester carboxylesterase